MEKRNISFLYILFTGLTALALITIYSSTPSLSLTTILSIMVVILSALLISWAAEAGQFIVSQGLAVAGVALLQVLPEFMVEGVIAWKREVGLIFANITGSNRLLMGVGWSGIYFISLFTTRRGKNILRYSIPLRREYIIETLALLVSSLYFIVIMMKKSLTLADGAVLGAIFIVYMLSLMKLPPEGEEGKRDLLPYPAYILSLPGEKRRKRLIAFLFLFGGISIILIADPFLESLKGYAFLLGIPAFFFIQWIAPFLTEFPEKLTAFYWASKERTAGMGLLNLVSSKVNQWSLLVTIIPVVFCISAGEIRSIPIIDEHIEEIFLSFAMTLFGVAILLKKSFNFYNAVALFILWFVQFVFPTTLPFIHIRSRFWIGVLFLLLALLELLIHWKRVDAKGDLRLCLSMMRGRRGEV